MNTTGIRAMRERLSLTQRELAELADVTPATVYRLEKGRHDPRPPTRRRIARALGVPVEELFVIHDGQDDGTAEVGRVKPEPGAASAKRDAGLARAGG